MLTDACPAPTNVDQCNALNHPWGNCGMGTECMAFHRFLSHRFPFHRLDRFPAWLLCYPDLIEKATNGWHRKKITNDGTNKSPTTQPWYIRRKAASSLFHLGVYRRCGRCPPGSGVMSNFFSFIYFSSCQRCQARPLDACGHCFIAGKQDPPLLIHESED